MVMMVVVVVMMVVIELSHLDLGLGGAGGLLIERLQLGRRVWYRLKQVSERVGVQHLCRRWSRGRLSNATRCSNRGYGTYQSCNLSFHLLLQCSLPAIGNAAMDDRFLR